MYFFQCPKCKKTWHYLIEKCPDCFLKLERIKSKKIKIIGGGQTIIPSIFHQKVPYFVYVLEDENNNRFLQKSDKELKVGDEFEVEKAKSKEAVAIWRVKYDFFESIEKVVDLLNFRLEKNLKILILPTLIKDSYSYLRDNTSPEFLEDVLEFLKESGIDLKNVKLVSQSFDEIDIEKKLSKSGMLEVIKRKGVIFYDLAKGNFVKKEDLMISQDVLSADLILNLPVLKIGRACASENLFFLLKKENFLAQKYLSCDKEIFEKLTTQIPPVLTIADANKIQDKMGIVHYFNLCFGSLNSKNVDRVFFQTVKEKELPEIIRDVNIENVEIVGRNIDEIEFYF